MKQLLVILWILCNFDLASQQIVEAEYYIDTDPGFGLATPITITPNQEISELLVSIDITGVSQGIHNLIVRVKDDNGSWSLAQEQTFLKSQLPSSSPIDELEYYYDIDPGEGNGNPLAITSNVEVSNHISAVSVSGLSEGVHRLYIRSRSEEGVWSHVATKTIFISPPVLTKDIIKLEYYVGDDPGFGNGNSISISASDDMPNSSVAIPIENLDFGVNNISIRGQDSDGFWSHSTTRSILKMKAPNVPNIEEIEYFFNNDPGFGNGTFVSYTPGPDWSDISVLISVDGLADGVHTLNIRSLDTEGKWSFTNSLLIQKTSIQELTDIIEMEYYFDVDPGYGSATQINITPDKDINDKVTSISVAGLSKGVHTLFIRTKDEQGAWSLCNSKTILIANPQIVTDIVEIEYYFDSDPGYGMGTAISLTELPNITDLNAVVSVTGLSVGIHHLIVRSKNGDGEWSLNYQKTFFYRSPDIDENIVKLEYYVGDDPGPGNGMDIAVPSFVAGPDIMDLQHLIDINSLSAGVHRLSIRSQNDLGVWSHTYTKSIYVNKNVNGNMVKAEYFIDTDPGYGMATEVTFAPTLDKINHIFPIDVSGLDYGIYKLHVRYLSENNKWTLDEIVPFYYKDDQLYEVVEGEYFIDEDPGFGLAAPFSFTPDIDVPDIEVLILTGDVDAGEHDLYVRTKNANGKWSLTNVKFDIEIESTLPLRILSFEVRKNGDEALLEWKVDKAINTSHFEIERTGNIDFIKIGKVASFNDPGVLEYNFPDANPLDGLNYYRLKQVDLDGSFKYSPIRSLNFDAKQSLLVYPNPSIDEVRVDGVLDSGASFKIYDSSHRLVKDGNVKANTSIDVSELLPGAYHFILRNDDEFKSFLIIKI